MVRAVVPAGAVEAGPTVTAPGNGASGRPAGSAARIVRRAGGVGRRSAGLRQDGAAESVGRPGTAQRGLAFHRAGGQRPRGPPGVPRRRTGPAPTDRRGRPSHPGSPGLIGRRDPRPPRRGHVVVDGACHPRSRPDGAPPQPPVPRRHLRARSPPSPYGTSGDCVSGDTAASDDHSARSRRCRRDRDRGSGDGGGGGGARAARGCRCRPGRRGGDGARSPHGGGGRSASTWPPWRSRAEVATGAQGSPSPATTA